MLVNEAKICILNKIRVTITANDVVVRSLRE